MKTGDIRVITQAKYRKEIVMILSRKPGSSQYYRTTYCDRGFNNQVFTTHQTREATSEEIDAFYKSHPEFPRPIETLKEINYEIY